MKFTEQRELIDEVDSAVHRVLRRLGYTSMPGRYWIKKEMQNETLLPDQDWSSQEVLNNNIDALVEEAVKWLEQEGAVPTNKSEPAPLLERTHTSIGWAYSTAQRIYPFVQETRLWLLGLSKAPFNNDSEGHDLAVRWIRKANEEDLQRLEGKRPGRVKVSILLEAEDALKLLSRTSTWHVEQLKKGEKVDLQTSVQDLVDACVGAKAIGWQADGGYDTLDGHSAPFLTLELTNSDGWREVMVIHAGTRLAELAARVSHIALAAGWWTHQETLDFIMCDSLPIPGVSVSAHQPESGPHAITLTVRGPATKSEVIKAYTSMLRELGLNPKSLTSTQGAILKLVAQTPGLSWGERFAIWLQWCDKNPNFPNYKRNLKAGPQSLYKEYKRAFEKAKW